MPDPITGIIAGGATLLGSSMQADAAGDAARAQSQSSEAGIAEQRRQFEKVQELLRPYVEAGTTAIGGLAPYAAAGAPALAQQRALSGIDGAQAQADAIRAIEQSPLLQAQMRQGEAAMLQNASATGGLRGGNLQGALAQFRPQMLSQAIADQYSRLGGLTGMGATVQQNLAQMGQASAAGQATAGMNTAGNIANLMAQQGAARAGGALAQGQAAAGMANAIPQGIGMYYGMTGQSPFGGFSAPAAAPSYVGGFGTPGMSMPYSDAGF